MTIGMYESRILQSHRPRRYGLLQVADVRTSDPSGTVRWPAGAEMSRFGARLHNVDLTACDVEVTGWGVAEGSSTVRLAFTSKLTAECTSLAGPETLDAMRADVMAEHRALLPYVVDTELILAQTSGFSAQALETIATRVNPSASLSAIDVLGHAEDVNLPYETVIMVPLGIFQRATDGCTLVDGVWRTRAGNAVVPHSAGEDVYVAPAPISIDLMFGGGGDDREWDYSRNVQRVQSTVVGLIEIAPEVYVFDPQP